MTFDADLIKTALIRDGTTVVKGVGQPSARSFPQIISNECGILDRCSVPDQRSFNQIRVKIDYARETKPLSQTTPQQTTK